MKKILIAALLVSVSAVASEPGDVQLSRRWLNGAQGIEPVFIPEPGSTAFWLYDKPNRTLMFKQLGTGFDCSTAFCNVTGGTGATGATGSAGSNGASAYEIAVANGFIGSQAAWLSSLVGPIGNTGATGGAGPTGASAAPFNYSAPAARIIAVSTAYQASDTAKAAMITISPACTNSTTLLAASACTMQIRQASAAGLTCSTGTVSSTWSSTVALGLVITQGNSFPVDVKLPIGGYFIVCPSSGTFTLSATEQSAG